MKLIKSPIYITRRRKIARAGIAEARRRHQDAVGRLKLSLAYTVFMCLYAALPLLISTLRRKNS
jgi:hypothetical protein